jgi:hypothetical protein
VVREQLEWDDVKETLKSVDGFGDADDALVRVVEAAVGVVGDDDGGTLASGDLLKGGANLREGKKVS